MAKPILLWRHNGELSPRQPDEFETMPNAITAQHVETLVAQGYEVHILEYFPEGHAVLTERHGPPLWQFLENGGENVNTTE